MKQWFVDNHGEVAGPFGHLDVCQWIKEGKLKQEDRVSLDRKTWFPAAVVGEMLAGLDGAAVARLAGTTEVQVPEFPGYVVIAVIGAGACGIVYRARQVKLDRLVALKTVSLDQAGCVASVSRFEKEAAVLARLQHPNIVQVFDFDRDAKTVFFAMELLEGEDLAARLARDARLDERTAWAIARQTAGALDHAARLGVYHRDVKPSNLFLVPAPSGFGLPKDLPLVKLMDFGLALTRQAGLATVVGRLTAAGVVIGTPLYMAPEQACNPQVDHRADIFALGATIFHALAGQPPFEGPTIGDLMGQKVQRSPRLGPPVSAESADLVAAMMAIDPDKRISSYEELLARIDNLPAMQGVNLRPEPLRPAPKKGPQRRPFAAAFCAILLCGAITAGTVFSPWRGTAHRLEASGEGADSFVTTGKSEQLFDGKSLLLWIPVGGQPWTIGRDDDMAPVLTGKGGVRRPFSPDLPDFRVVLGVDLFQARACEISIEDAGSEGRARLSLNVSREAGAVAGRWIGNRERFEPIGEGVPFPTEEELEGKAPYLEVRFERALDRLSVLFRGRKVASQADHSMWKKAIVRIDAEQGAIWLDSAVEEKLQPIKSDP
jgi:eukaryotic-like serine/threonine-protein kinase